MPRSPFRLIALTLALTLATSLPASAQNLYWDTNGTTTGAGGTPTGTWGVNNFWNTSATGTTGGTFQTATTGTDNLFFVAGPSGASGNGNYIVTVSGSQAANGMTFQASGGSTLSSGTIGLGAGGITMNQFAFGSTGQGAVTISNSTALVLTATQTWTNNSVNTLTWGGGLNLGANTLTFAGSGNFTTTAGSLSGAGGSVVHNGSGTVILRNGSGYTGTTTVSGGGTLMIHTGKSSGNYNITNGILTDYFQSNFVFSSGLGSGSNQIQITGSSGLGGGNGTSQWTIGALNSALVWGGTFFNPTTLGFFSPADNMGPTTFGIVQLNNGLDLSGSARSINVRGASGGSAALLNSRAIITGPISGTAGSVLVKEGAGNLQFTGSNSYADGTNINNGMVWFTTRNSMPASGTVAVANGAILGVTVANSATTWVGGTGNAGIAGLTNGLGGRAGGVVSFAGNSSLLFNVAADTTESNTVSNGGATNLSIIKQGANALTLSGTNTFTGSVAVNQGALNLSGPSAFSSASITGGALNLSNDNSTTGAVSLNSGTLQLAHVNALDTASAVNALAGTLLQLRSNTAATFATPLTRLGGTGAAAGTMTLDVNRVSSGTGNQLVLNGGLSSQQDHGNENEFTFTGGNGYTLSVPTLAITRFGGGGGGGGLRLNATTTSVAIGTVSASSTQAFFFRLTGTSTGNTVGAISNPAGTVSLQKQGTGTWTLTGSNTYTGTTGITGGVLNIQHANALGTTGANTSVAAGAALEIQGGITVGPEPLSLIGTGISSGGALRNISGTNTFGGLVTLTGATRINSDAGRLILSNAGTITGTTFGLTFGGAGDISIASNIGTTTGGVTKDGAGMLTLSGSNTYTGTTAIQGGTLLFTRPASLYGGTTASWTATSINVQSGATLGLRVGGTGEFTTGNVTTLLTNLASSTSASTGMNAGSGFAFDTTNASGGSFTIADVIADSTGANGGARSVTKLGSGRLVLTGSNTYTGSTLVSAGTLALNGNLSTGTVSVAAAAWLQGTGTIAGPVNVLGTLSPGSSPGVITLGSVTLGGASTTLIEIDGVVRGTDYDGVNITGTSSSLTYGGLLSLNFGALATTGVTYDIFNFAGGFLGGYTTVTSTGAYVGTWTNLGSGTFQFVSGAQTLTFSESTGDIIVVPEPATIALAGLGLAGVAAAVRRRRMARRG
jgi:fibronectin-binding autotransporter adhesin